MTDYTVLAAYLLGITLVGGVFFAKQKNLGDFLVAGRSIAWLPAAISIIATDFSASSFCGVPAYVFQKDLKLLISSFSILLVTPIIIRLFLPVYLESKVFTAYEYLEKRFDLRVRLFASFLFLLVRGGYIGVVIYAPSIVLSVITGLPLTVCVLLMGLLTTIYTSLGGMKAVIWTDFVQFGVIAVGLVFISWAVIAKTNSGFVEIWQVAESAGRLETFDFSLDPRIPVTFWGALIGGSFWLLNSYGTDQMILQRYLATRSPAECRRSLST